MNINVLAGIKCPKCGSENLFNIECITTATFSDEGSERYGDMEWQDDSHIECLDCNHCGDVKDFRITEEVAANTTRETATIIAALLYWKREGLMSSGHEVAIASNGGDIEPLTAEEIDKLCERLNAEEGNA
jgi:hypothetical protein